MPQPALADALEPDFTVLIPRVAGSRAAGRLLRRTASDRRTRAGLAVYAVALGAMRSPGHATANVPGGNVGLISRYVLDRGPGDDRAGRAVHIAGSTVADSLPGRGGRRPQAPAALDTLHIQRAAGPAVRAPQAYPFSSAFTLGCHCPELGSHLDPSTPQPTRGALDTPAAAPGGPDRLDGGPA
ncbi:hypothetical protein [Amycolatopsis sp. Hca4]|uniref:hypothetical protein n=1 Tax=Amycolatopsis sp. Hca4 TaxID=2742131 RepID=UPI0015902D5E|nr:hypothetical protein [Amycolatopsis sp. Hca4]QKV75286.1 hypothetical protein HUT10_17050 [Amycolatopsis sp. Hca4]